jgi:hypothetical protein
MFGYKLGIEELEFEVFQLGYKMNKRDFAGIALNGKHAFAKECMTQ